MHILPSIYRQSVHFFEHSFLPQSTSQQKKISVLALMAFSCLAACYAIYRCCCFKAYKEESDIKFKPIPEPLILSQVSQKEQDETIKAIQEFTAYEVLPAIMAKSTTDNVLVSSLGIALLLSMIKPGVGPDDQEEITTLLHLPKDENTLKESAFRLIKKLQSSGIDIASLLYLNDHYRLNPDYQNLASQYYRSKVQSGSSATEVNAWVKHATNGKIQDIISQDDLTDFFLVLANAIHFKGEWSQPFNETDTVQDDFHTPNGKVKVDMMHTVNKCQYFENNDCKLIELTYKNHPDIKLKLILPEKNNDFSCFNSGHMMTQKETVAIALPKFKIEYETDVKELLSTMDVDHLFNQPDFAPLADLNHGPTKAALPKLQISKMVQKTTLEFHEKGTEASASTAAVIVQESFKPIPPYSKEVNFNRPFFVDLSFKDTTLFFGIVRNPIS